MQNTALYTSEKWAETASSGESSLSGMFKGMITDAENWKDHLANFFSQVANSFASMAADMMARAAMMKMMGIFVGAGASAAGGGGGTFENPMAVFGAPEAHRGGRVGSLAASRLVDSSVFANAPRFHGLRPGERAVIAQDDEVISRPGGGAAAIGGPTTVNYITIKALDTQDVKRALAKEKNFVADLTFSATKGNHPAGRYER
jgi:hypothetical protein